MSLRLPSRVLSSAAFRLTMIYASLFVIVTLAVILLGGAVAMAILKADLKDEVIKELQALQAVLEMSGEPALVATIEARSRETRESGIYYQLATPSGNTLAGNLALSEIESGWFDFVPPDEEDDEAFLARAVEVGGLWLVVAADLESVHDTWELMLAGTGWTLGISFPLALVCGGMMSALVLRRIETISATTREIREGGLDRRAPLRGTNDEFDRLTTHINAMLDSIEALTRNIHEVSSGIAHDLRTPLTRVSNRLQGLRGQQLTGVRLDEEIDVLLGEIASLLTTFDALLRIGEIEAGTRRAGFRALDFSGLVGELAETYEVMAAANEKTLVSTIEPGIETQGDRALLVQMIVNVLENAIVHTPAHTEISMTLTAGSEAVSLAIEDNGPGVPEADRERVFTRFYRADRSRRTNGNGLGMSIVRSIAMLHGIKVDISNSSPGLRVTFMLPATAAADRS